MLLAHLHWVGGRCRVTVHYFGLHCVELAVLRGVGVSGDTVALQGSSAYLIVVPLVPIPQSFQLLLSLQVTHTPHITPLSTPQAVGCGSSWGCHLHSG